MYSFEKEYEFKSYSMKEIESCERRSVASMDISENNLFLVAGYSNGYLALWDLQNSKCKKLIMTHKSCVVACKFIRNTNKRFEIISCDVDGNVYKMIIEDGFFSTSFESQCLFKNDSAIFIISILKLNENDKKLFPELNKGLIVALGCLDYIMVCMFDPESRKLFKFDKPKYVRDNYVPDVSFGIGYGPPTDNVNDESILSQILVHNFSIAGHYTNLTPIIRMGFISNSIIFFFDSKKFVKVVNTSLFKSGDVQLSEDNDMPNYLNSNEFRKADLQDEKEIDQDLAFQTYVIDKVEGKTKATYVNTIITLNKFIFILAKKGFYQLKLLNWKQCLENLYSKSEWMDALTLGLDIFYGMIICIYIRKDNIFSRHTDRRKF